MQDVWRLRLMSRIRPGYEQYCWDRTTTDGDKTYAIVLQIPPRMDRVVIHPQPSVVAVKVSTSETSRGKTVNPSRFCVHAEVISISHHNASCRTACLVGRTLSASTSTTPKFYTAHRPSKYYITMSTLLTTDNSWTVKS